MDIEVRERSYGFEAVKTALRQTKDGIAVTIVVHPNDVPSDLMSDPIGSRYMIGMARLDEQEQIIEPESVKEGRKLSNQAGMFCRDQVFQQWLVDADLSFAVDEESAIAAVREFCVIDSRSELKSNIEAQTMWIALLARFESRGE
jgi:hypothetical protein|tara:strand:+ start:2094 stop:2528 length:435 start_codon:yes stop_codon:yes gene_type:complete